MNIYDDVTEADRIEDYYYIDEDEIDVGIEERLREKRRKRIGLLENKFLVVCKHNGNTLYIQDKNISSHGYWTRFLSNAKGYDTYSDAFSRLSSLKYNNPRIMKVVDGNVLEVRRKDG